MINSQTAWFKTSLNSKIRKILRKLIKLINKVFSDSRELKFMKEKIITLVLSLEGRGAVTRWMNMKMIISRHLTHYFLQGNAKESSSTHSTQTTVKQSQCVPSHWL